MMVGNAVRQIMSIGKATMGPSADITEFVKPIEQWAGVEVGKKA
jgi:2-hydroxy-3-oxopropionate reductase